MLITKRVEVPKGYQRRATATLARHGGDEHPARAQACYPPDHANSANAGLGKMARWALKLTTMTIQLPN